MGASLLSLCLVEVSSQTVMPWPRSRAACLPEQVTPQCRPKQVPSRRSSGAATTPYHLGPLPLHSPSTQLNLHDTAAAAGVRNLSGSDGVKVPGCKGPVRSQSQGRRLCSPARWGRAGSKHVHGNAFRKTAAWQMSSRQAHRQSPSRQVCTRENATSRRRCLTEGTTVSKKLSLQGGPQAPAPRPLHASRSCSWSTCRACASQGGATGPQQQRHSAMPLTASAAHEPYPRRRTGPTNKI